jgi:outer membrane lipoprotein-sorting protein
MICCKKIFLLILVVIAPLALVGIGQGQKSNKTPQLIIKKMAAQYAAASSYQDEGVVEDFDNRESRKRSRDISFKTYFIRPLLFRFTWVDHASEAAAGRTSVIWSDGEKVYASYYFAPEEEIVSLRRAIAGATGVSYGAAQTISRMLMEDVAGYSLAELKKLSLLGQEKFEEEECYVIRGYDPSGYLNELWIGKRDYLLRKYRTTWANGAISEEIHRNIKLNSKIPIEVFTSPPTKKF